VAFCALTLNESSARLGGVVTGKRVAARQRLAEDFGLGSVSMHFSSAEGLKSEELGTNSFLADSHLVWKWFLACRNAIGRRFLADRCPNWTWSLSFKSSSWKWFLAYEIELQAFLADRPIDARAHIGATHHLRYSQTTARKLLAPISSGLSPSEPEKPYRD